ncbi:MAG: histidine phosphatase family protein [Bacteroidaceae bacterium]|nr:histidine phosphatase family protein [Bacteroidaceae bacterium]
MVKIYLTRHGETIENSRGLFQGHAPGHLSDKGKEQAALLGITLKDMTFDAMFCSDLQRCKDTAAIALGERVADLNYTHMLRERDMGNFSGKEIKGAVLDDSVESTESMLERAKTFLRFLDTEYAGKKVLVISHGYFARIIQSVIENVDYTTLHKLDNCEVREFVWSE